MNKDFWERIDKLEELARKATQGEWNYCGCEIWANETVNSHDVVGKTERFEDAQYIDAANPAMIREIIAEMRRLEKEADWLAEKARKCSFAYRNRSCHHLCVGNCSICLYDNRIVTAQDFREAARKAVSEADNA